MSVLRRPAASTKGAPLAGRLFGPRGKATHEPSTSTLVCLELALILIRVGWLDELVVWQRLGHGSELVWVKVGWRRGRHAKHKMVLVVDEKLEHLDSELVLCRRLDVRRVGEHAGLEDDGEITRRHQVLVRLLRKDGKKVENIEQEILVGWRHARDEEAVGADGTLGVEWLLGHHVAELGVEVEWYNGLWHVVKVPSEDACRVVDTVLGPVDRLAVLSGGGVGGGGAAIVSTKV